MLDHTDVQALLQQAWDQSFADPIASRDRASRALDIAEPGGDDAAWCFWLLGLADLHTGQPGEARGRLQTARALFVQRESARGQALCAELDAAIALASGDPIRASLIHRALDGAQGFGLRAFDRFFGQLHRGLFARLLGQWQKALAHFQQARDAAEISRIPACLAAAQVQLGGLQLEFGELAEAQSRCEAALSLARHAGARGIITSAASNLIVIHDGLGRRDLAQDMASFLLDHPHAQGPGALARAAVPLALACLGAGDLDRAEAWLESGSSATSHDGDNGVFWAWLSARCLLARGEPRMARDLAERTLAARQAQALPYHLAQLLEVTADACETLGQHDQAQAYRASVRVRSSDNALARGGAAPVTSAAGYRPDVRRSEQVS